MATAVEVQAAPARSIRRVSVRRPFVVALATALVGVLVAGLVLAVTGTAYKPKFGDIGVTTWPVTLHRLAIVTDGLGHDTWAITGPAQTRAVVAYSLSNDGGDPITLLGLQPDVSLPGASLRFAPFDIRTAGGEGRPPSLREARPGPYVLRPGAQATLFLTVFKPGCPGGGFFVLEGFGIRYSALGLTHTFTYPLTIDGGANRPIALCAPKEALSRAEK